jgi:cytoskeleton protein RodZ
MKRHPETPVGGMASEGPDREKVGKRLQQARVKAGLSLAEISARTKIRQDFLDAIERDDFERLPRGLTTRGFLRAFAHEVRLDKESIIHQFHDEFEVNPIDPEPASMPVEAADSHESQPYNEGASTRPQQFLVAALAAALAVFMLPGRQSASGGAATLRSAATTGTGTSLSTDSHVVDAPPETASDVGAGGTDDPQVQPLAVAISPSGPVWVEASTDGSQVLYQLLYPGERRVIDVRDELLLLVGDAAAFQYSINGVVGRRLGPPGEVRRIRITRENYGEFQDR